MLADLIEAYEDRTFRIDATDPVDFLSAFMAISGRTQNSLARLLGSPSRASEVLRRKRRLTIEMIHRLHDEWGAPADALIEPYRLTG